MFPQLGLLEIVFVSQPWLVFVIGWLSLASLSSNFRQRREEQPGWLLLSCGFQWFPFQTGQQTT
jgi:hypothetical protein